MNRQYTIAKYKKIHRKDGLSEMTSGKIDLNELIDKVAEKHIEITVNITPENTEITLCPWRPFTMGCPYDVKMEDDE